jgi:hypothetical protein
MDAIRRVSARAAWPTRRDLMSSKQASGDHQTVAPPSTDRIIHYTDWPYTHGICGTVLPDDRFRGAPVSCVVCIDLNENG